MTKDVADWGETAVACHALEEMACQTHVKGKEESRKGKEGPSSEQGSHEGARREPYAIIHVVPAMKGQAASPAAETRAQGCDRCKAQDRGGEAAAYERMSDEDYGSFLESEGEEGTIPDGIVRGHARLHCARPFLRQQTTTGASRSRRRGGARRSVVVCRS